MSGYSGELTIHHQPHKFFTFITETELMRPILCQKTPALGPTYFTNGSGKTGRAITVWHENREWHHEEQIVQGSAQIVELAAIVFAFQHCHRPMNLVTDSQYIAGVVSRLDCLWLKEATDSNILLF